MEKRKREKSAADPAKELEEIKAISEKRGKRLSRRRLIKKFAVYFSSAAAVLAIAILAYFFPYRDLLPALAVPARGEGETRIHFIDVGEGDATLVEFSSGDALLIDAGCGDFLNSQKILRYLRGVNFRTLSVVATHSDGDHCGGIADVLKEFKTEKLYLPVIPAETGAYQRMLDAAGDKKIPLGKLTRYDTIEDTSGAYIVCLSPHAIDETDENDASALLYMNVGGIDLLFGADISSVRERRLLDEYALDPTIFDSGNCKVDLSSIDILRVSHHGSAYSSDGEWLSLLNAEMAVISCGEDNRYAHPSEEAVGRLAANTNEIYRTDETGDIVVTISDGAYSAQILGKR